jgi:hypothetical protein
MEIPAMLYEFAAEFCLEIADTIGLIGFAGSHEVVSWTAVLCGVLDAEPGGYRGGTDVFQIMLIPAFDPFVYGSAFERYA